jgi:hypothetical protein
VTVRTSHASERSLYVSPYGDDKASGTLRQPFATVGHALGQAVAGTTIYLRGGLYEEMVTDAHVRPGTASAPIVLRAFKSERPEIRGLLWLSSPTHWIIRGLTVSWSASARSDQHMVKIEGGDSWRFEDNTLRGARSYAALLVAGDANDWVVRGNSVTDTHESNGKNQDHLIYVNTSGTNGLIEGNYLADSPNGRAIKVGPPESGGPPVPGPLTIRYNTMERNKGPSSVQLAYSTSNVLVERNIMVSPGENYACVTAHELAGENNVVRDNLVWLADHGAVEPGVDGLIDGGGNVTMSPDLSAGRYGLEAFTAP